MIATAPSNALELLRAERSRRAVALRRPGFASEVHERFFDSEAPELLLSGWMGAGKSRILCAKAWWLALRYPGAELLLTRKIANSLTATTERTFWEDVADTRFVVDRNKSERWVDVSAGGKPSRIWFLGLDPDPITRVPSKIGSLNLDWAGVDEAIELSEQDWIMVGGRLRRTRIPYRQVAAATNPGSPKHWLKARFTPTSAQREYLAATENRFLPEDYKARLASLGNGVHAQRLAKGLWVAAEGVIWVLPEEQIRPADTESFHVVVGGLDWGFVHAFAAEIVGQTGTGRLAVIDEVYEHGKLLEDVLPQLLDLQERHNVAAWFADPSEPAYILKCRKAGLRIVEADNSIDPGLQAVSSAIAAGMTVDPRCQGLLGEIPGYTWMPAKGGGFQERPIEKDDDACDALRYAVVAFEPIHAAPVVTYDERVEISPF